MGSAVAVILIKERHVVEAFERAGATSADRAVSPQELDVDEFGIGWRRVTRDAIVRQAGNGRFYLDAEVWQATRRRRRLTFVAVLIAALVGALALFAMRAGQALP